MHSIWSRVCTFRQPRLLQRTCVLLPIGYLHISNMFKSWKKHVACGSCDIIINNVSWSLFLVLLIALPLPLPLSSSSSSFSQRLQKIMRNELDLHRIDITSFHNLIEQLSWMLFFLHKQKRKPSNWPVTRLGDATGVFFPRECTVHSTRPWSWLSAQRPREQSISAISPSSFGRVKVDSPLSLVNFEGRDTFSPRKTTSFVCFHLFVPLFLAHMWSEFRRPFLGKICIFYEAIERFHEDPKIDNLIIWCFPSFRIYHSFRCRKHQSHFKGFQTMWNSWWNHTSDRRLELLQRWPPRTGASRFFASNSRDYPRQKLWIDSLAIKKMRKALLAMDQKDKKR